MMFFSLRSNRLSGVAVAALMSGAMALQAHAQSGTLGSMDLSPIADEPVTVSPSDGYQVDGFADDIAADALSAPSTEAAGLATAPALGLSAGMWANTDAGTALRLVDATTPTPYHSVNHLLRRALVASATPPANADGLLAARARALLRFGAAEEAASLASIGASGSDLDLHRVASQAALLVGRDEALCGAETMATAEQIADDDRFWPSLRGYCLALTGDPLAAVAIHAMRELGTVEGADASMLEALVDRSLIDYVVPPAPETLTPLRIAMLRGLGRANGQLIDPAPLPAIAGLFSLESTGARGALRAAERLEAAGAIPTEMLRDFYVTLADEVGDTDVGARAKAIKAAVDAPDAQQIGQALIAVARSGGVAGFAQMARVIGESAATLPPSSAIGLGAEGFAIRDALLLSGNVREAGIWSDSQGAKQLIEQADSSALLAVADIGWPGVWRRELGDALRGRARNGDEHARRALASLAAFELAPRPNLPPHPATDAAADGRTAEAVFQAASALSAEVPVSARTLDVALRALRQVGLDADARRIATEIMLVARWQ